MKQTALLLMMLLSAMNGFAQEFATHWIACPDADSTSQVWFRHTYIADGAAASATITVATTGLFELYINERNVSTDVLMPCRKPFSDNPEAITFDVTRF